jgi:hypothetical protein
MRVSRFVVVVAVGALLAACSSGAEADSGRSTPAPSRTTGSSAPASPHNSLGGIGSTPAVMAAVHGTAQPATGPCSVPGACYGPPVTNSQNGPTYAFASVALIGGLVGGYVQNFPNGSSVYVAMKAVLAALPPDSHTSRLTTISGATASCAFINITSPTIAALFPNQSPEASAGEFTNTMVGVELSGTNANGYMTYDWTNVQVARVTLGADTASMAC